MTTTQNLPAVQDDATGALAIPEHDEWADVDDGAIGKQTIEPTVPLLNFNANFGYGFEDELTGTKVGAGETLRAVWLANKESRAYWSKAFGEGDAAPDCRSNDMIVPDESSPDKQSATCATCPHSQWTDEGAPRCGVSENVMLYLPDEQRITRTSFRGIAIKHVQRFLGGFSTRVPKRPPMAFITEITPTVEATKYGDKLAPHFKLGNPITRDEAAPLIALRDQLMQQWQEEAAKDLLTAQPENAPGKVGPFDAADVIDVESDEEPF